MKRFGIASTTGATFGTSRASSDSNESRVLRGEDTLALVRMGGAIACAQQSTEARQGAAKHVFILMM
jgi:hypothetical protein